MWWRSSSVSDSDLAESFSCWSLSERKRSRDVNDVGTITPNGYGVGGENAAARSARRDSIHVSEQVGFVEDSC